MRQRLRSHLTYANVISTLCLFLLLGGGSAIALTGSNTVQSDDLGPGAQVRAPDVADDAVNGADVLNNSLTNADVMESTLQGVDAWTVDGASVCHFDIGYLLPNVTYHWCFAGPLELTTKCARATGDTTASVILENRADHSFYAASSGAEDANWNRIDGPVELVVATDSSAPAIDRTSFSAGATDGSQLAGEVAARARDVADTGICHFSTAVIH
jgi:hypothetical protein